MDPFAKPPTISDDYRMAEIYRLSSEVFYEKGFEVTTMAEIAESVDLTQGGLYYYIKGKKALLFAIMSYAMDLLENEVLHPARRLDDPKECLELMVSGYLRLIREEPTVMAMLAEQEAELEKTHAAKIRPRKQMLRDFLCDVIASLVAGRVESVGDPAEIATQLLKMIHSVHSWNMEGQLAHDEATHQVIEHALHGVTVEEMTSLAS